MWLSKSFQDEEGYTNEKESDEDLLMKFLNEGDIDNFVIIRQGDDYIDILYKTK